MGVAVLAMGAAAVQLAALSHPVMASRVLRGVSLLTHTSERSILSMRGGWSPLDTTMLSEDEVESMRMEYERYKAKVEMPLSNYDEATAQHTRAIRVRGLLSRDDIAAVHLAGQAFALQQPAAIIDRSAWGQPNGTWLVSYLNAHGAFEAMLPFA